MLGTLLRKQKNDSCLLRVGIKYIENDYCKMVTLNDLLAFNLSNTGKGRYSCLQDNRSKIST